MMDRFLLDNIEAEVDAFVADEGLRPGDQLFHALFGSSAEGAFAVFFFIIVILYLF